MPSTLKLLDSAQKWMICCKFLRPERARSVAGADRSTGGGRTQWTASLDGRAGEAAQGVVGELEVVALAQQDAEQAIALARG